MKKIAILLVIVLLTGCVHTKWQSGGEYSEEYSGEYNGDSSSESVSLGDGSAESVLSESLASDIKEKYAEGEKYDYQTGMKEIARDEHIKLQMGFDITGREYERYDELVAVYQDPDLKHQIGTSWEWDEETKILAITPPKNPVCGIGNQDWNEEMDANGYGVEAGAYTLFDKGQDKDWGNLQQYYLAQFVDFETGDPLDKPIVKVMKTQHEIISAPRLKVSTDDAGITTFSWEAVEGADIYYVMELDYDKDGGYAGMGTPLGSTDKTSWVPDKAYRFQTYKVSEYERSLPENIEEYGEGTEVIPKDEIYDTHLAVIAVSEVGTSPISNIYTEKEIAQRIPQIEEVEKGKEEGSNRPESILTAPAYKWVTMCDGSLVQRLVNYDFSRAEATTHQYGEYENPDMSDLRVVNVDVVEIPYMIDKTTFEGMVVVENFDPETWEEELDKLEKRQEELRVKSGAISIEMSDGVPEETQEMVDTEVVYGEFTVTANSALAEYLAVNMLYGKVVIDISEFPESEDDEYLADAWLEAIYQNPLILGANGAYTSEDGKTLYVAYDYDAATMKEKREEIQQIIPTIIDEIITEEMSELDKEFAINQYLCDTAEYDMEALNNAEENDFAYVDDEFLDAFTPYGVLINKVGVCASYAASFKLLADAAGLDSIVVTGYLEGTLPHAWNKVKVDGDWHIVDSTNNDNEALFNALLNLSDKAAEKVLVEDTAFVMDSKISYYAAITEDSEFYRIHERFFDIEAAATELAADIEEHGGAILRTNYDLSDEQFDEIVLEVIEKTGIKELQGYHWMGVVVMGLAWDAE